MHSIYSPDYQVQYFFQARIILKRPSKMDRKLCCKKHDKNNLGKIMYFTHYKTLLIFVDLFVYCSYDIQLVMYFFTQIISNLIKIIYQKSPKLQKDKNYILIIILKIPACKRKIVFHFYTCVLM